MRDKTTAEQLETIRKGLYQKSLEKIFGHDAHEIPGSKSIFREISIDILKWNKRRY